MSYDGYIFGIDREQMIAELGNSTTNHSRVWSKALRAAGFDGRLRDTDGMRVSEAAVLFRAAADHIRGNWAEYDAMHPRDSMTGERIEWYDLEKATAYLENAAAQCAVFAPYTPAMTVHWSS